MVETIEQRIMRHEGYRDKIYLDSRGYETIGWGTKINKDQKSRFINGITEAEAQKLFDDRLGECWHYCIVAISTTFHRLDPLRQEVIAEMVYQLGIKGVLKFKKMLAALDRQDFDEAADQMLESLWCEQTPSRCKELAGMMRKGQQEDAVS